jgi:long-chain acyl-CoA synthetase
LYGARLAKHYRSRFGTVILMSERTVFRLLEEAAAAFGEKPALFEPQGGRGGDKQWLAYSWLDYKKAVKEVAAGLYGLGVRPGDIVALSSETRIEFYFADLGIMTAGAVATALYTAYPPGEQVKTLRALSPRVVFVENPKLLGALLSTAEPPLDTSWILLTGEADGARSFSELRLLGRHALDADSDLIETLQQRIHASDPAILYLTSGATGEPKMGLVSHAAVVANADMAPGATPLGPDDCSIAFLPSAHITQRIAMEMVPIKVGMPVYFSEGLNRLPMELKAVRPTFFVAPPRVWERMYSSICTEIKKRSAPTQRLFYLALGMGAEAARRRAEGRSVPPWISRTLALADRVMFRQIRDRLGGRMRMAVSGAAPLGKDLADFYAAIGLPIYEGYGLTEGGIVALNPFGRPKSGSIGKPLEGVEMKIAGDGELIFRSPSLFMGYYRSPEATSAVLRDGWLHTGDVAEFDSDGYVYITGRKKEVLVSSNGKKIYPALVEGLMKMEPLINQVLLLGDKQPYVAALLTLNTTAVEALPGMQPFRARPQPELVRAAPVVAEVKRIVQKVNRQLAPFEQIRKYHVLDRDFSIEEGELTPTMKVRRTRVIENHRRIIGDLFLGKGEGDGIV